MIHYHPDHPENHNLLLNISGLKMNLGKIWNGEQWFLKNKNELISDLMSTSYVKIDEKYDQFHPELNQFKRNNYANFRKEFENPSEQFLKEMRNTIELILLNYSKQVIEELKRRKLLEKATPDLKNDPILKDPVKPSITANSEQTVNSLETKVVPPMPDYIPQKFRQFKSLDEVE
jgi:hypothetical protein